ncbi:MAG: hypothetical protein ACFE8U_09925 [Candidatus Hermodarchaeota archaeon]
MSEQRVHVFMPSEDGEYVPVKFVSAENDLKEDQVLIFLDEDERSIFIWTGSESPVRKRFISSQIARQMRLEKGLTHRISTEDQGNETDRFLAFIERLKGMEIKPTALLEVSPPPGAADLPPAEPRKVKKKRVKVPDKEKVETLKAISIQKELVTTPSPKKAPIEAPPSPTSIAVPTTERKKIKPIKEMYFFTDQSTEVPVTKAKILYKAVDENLTLSTLHISTVATEGKIALYKVPKTTKTTICKTEKPIFVVYLKPDSSSVLELDDLHIPIPAGNSIYFTCPASTFIGINLSD